MGARAVVIHGHFYQPPREDPWLDVVEREPSAAPCHDWNERVERECYRAVVAARRYAPDGRIADVVNTLESISFDFGPTLLAWLERRAPRTYAAVLEADRLSCARRDGHGNALAMPYHHVILPLASRRDKITEVRWGVADFRRRFGREPEGMWLPETAVDDETLDVLAAEGIAFTVLAPHQVADAPARGFPGRYRTASGRLIALFTYDGGISGDVAFGNLLRDAETWLARLLAPDPAVSDRALVAVATDGETFGHHRRFGEVALAWLLGALEAHPGARVDNFAAFLARHPPETDVRLVAPSSWSCPHGVERWRADCGCRVAPERPTQQRWRARLRDALDWLAGELHEVYAREGQGLRPDPWSARDAYGEVVAANGAALAAFAAAHVDPAAGPAARVRARELLELERNALRMFTSCGWFFDDIAGVEAVQVLRYAAGGIALAGAAAPRLEAELLERLAAAPSNDPSVPTGAAVYREHARPRVPPAVRAAAGYAAVRAVVPEAGHVCEGCHVVSEENGDLRLTHVRTGREYRFRAVVERTGGGRLRVSVTGEDGAPAGTLDLDELPEVAREAVAERLREDLVERALAPADRRRLASGAAALPDVTANALVAAVEHLAGDQSSAALAAVADLADLLELQRLHIPFDAQTAMHRVRAGATPEARAALAPAAWRLGFTPGD